MKLRLCSFATALLLPLAAHAGMKEDCVQSTDPDLSIAGCTAVIRSGLYDNKSVSWANYNRGNAYSDLGELRRAIIDYDQAIRLNPEHANSYNNRGNAYKRLGEHRRAITDYDQAIRIDPAFVLAHYNRGFVYSDLGEHHRAITDFDKAIRLDPEFAYAYNNRGGAYENLGDNDQAMRDYETAIRIGGSSRVKRWQKRLTETGFYDGAIDGKYGPNTRAALRGCTEDPEC